MTGEPGKPSDDKALQGVSGGSQAELFENFDADERLLAESQPFRVMPRGGSRKGVPNMRTTALRELYLKMGLPHPVLWMGQVLSLSVEDLKEKLGGGSETSLLDVLDLQRKIAADLAPYLESKMPTKLDLPPNEGLPVLVVRELDPPRAIREARASGALAIDDDLAEQLGRDEENQGVAGDATHRSHGEGSQGHSQEPDKPSETGS